MGEDRFTRGAGFIDGQIVPMEDARIPIVDAGFSRSDVTYDVVGVWDGAFFRLDDHLERFERSCASLHLTLPYARPEVEAVLMSLMRATGLQESYVEVLCTRGVPPAGSRDPRMFENRFYAYAIPYVWILPDAEAQRGMDAVITRSVQRIPATSVDPKVKNFHWGDITRAMYEAYDRGGRYPILLDADGNVTEGAGYNIFAVVGGEIVTPAKGVLEGITRRTVLELAARHGITASVADISGELLRTADEVFATSTAGGIMPVTSIDGVPLGGGRVGALTEMIRSAYWRAHHDPAYITPIDYGTDQPPTTMALLGSAPAAQDLMKHEPKGESS
jgi:branched-chain amino acid aminotransferase